MTFGLAQGRTAWELKTLVHIAPYPPWALAQQLAFRGVLLAGLPTR